MGRKARDRASASACVAARGRSMKATGIRVTGGRLGGRRLRAAAPGVRPSSDRVREALFARLGDLSGRVVLDLYAGTGVLGADFPRGGARRLRGAGAGLPRPAARERRGPGTGRGGPHRGRGCASGGPPPGPGRGAIRPGAARPALRRRRGGARPGGAERVLAEGALVVVEHGRRHPLPPVAGLGTLDTRRYGETIITRLTAVAEAPVGGPGGE